MWEATINVRRFRIRLPLRGSTLPDQAGPNARWLMRWLKSRPKSCCLMWWVWCLCSPWSCWAPWPAAMCKLPYVQKVSIITDQGGAQTSTRFTTAVTFTRQPVFAPLINPKAWRWVRRWIYKWSKLPFKKLRESGDATSLSPSTSSFCMSLEITMSSCPVLSTISTCTSSCSAVRNTAVPIFIHFDYPCIAFWWKWCQIQGPSSLVGRHRQRLYLGWWLSGSLKAQKRKETASQLSQLLSLKKKQRC